MGRMQMQVDLRAGPQQQVAPSPSHPLNVCSTHGSHGGTRTQP